MKAFINKHFGQKNVIEYIVAILFVYGNGSWLYMEYKNPTVALLLIAISFYLYYVIRVYKEFQTPNVVVCFLALFPILSCIVNIGNGGINIMSVVYVAITYILLGCFTRERLLSLLDKYARFICFLAAVTIVLFPLFLSLPRLLTLVPLTATSFSLDEYGYYNFIVMTVRASGNLRAQSIFWEPGAWAFNLAFSTFWLLLVKKEIKKLPVLIIAMFFTFSTTGFALGLVLLVTLLLKSNDKKTRKTILYTIATLIILTTIVSIYLNAAFNVDVVKLLSDQIVGKFTGDSYTSVSYDDRKESTQKAFNVAISNPILGVGKLQAETMLFVTSSIAEISYTLGFIYLFIFIFLFRLVFKPMGLIFSFIYCMIMLNGESYGSFILASVIIIYGAKEAMVATPFMKKLFRKSPAQIVG